MSAYNLHPVICVMDSDHTLHEKNVMLISIFAIIIVYSKLSARYAS